MGWIMFCLTIIAIAIIIMFGCLAYNEKESIVQTWCDARKHVSDNKKEVELRRLDVLEKTPELRQLIFHPKTLEKEEKTSD